MTRGHLRIYLGVAPGAGKTFAMLEEGLERRARGEDVVVAWAEPHDRTDTSAKLEGLEVIPRIVIREGGTRIDAMDLGAVLRRRPAVALVDDLAHRNGPGSAHDNRWHDVAHLLEEGIDVISAVDIEQLESIHELAARITGVHQTETVPDVVVRDADEVELVDVTPEALRRRMAHGDIYPAERVDAALANYFRPGNLAALRQLALLWVADRVDDALDSYLEAHGIVDTWETRERIVVAVTGAPGGGELIRRAARIATRARSDLIGVHVAPASGARLDSGQLQRHRTLVRDLGGTYHEIVSDDTGRALAQFARSERATQLVMGTSRRTRTQRILHGNVIDAVLANAEGLDVHVIATASPTQAPRLYRARRGGGVAPRRKLWGWVLGALALPVVTATLVALRDDTPLSTVLLAYLAIVVATAAVGGAGPGLAAAAAAFLLENYFFVLPLHTLTVHGEQNAVALVAFLAFASVVSVIVNRLARRTREVDRVRAEAEALARMAGNIAGEAEVLPGLVDNIRAIFGLEAVALLERTPAGWRIVASAGDDPPAEPSSNEVQRVDDNTVIALRGLALEADDRKLLSAFAAQAATAIRTRDLRRETARVETLAHADAVRTGLLRAVSHDLRTPLAGIKASVTSMLQDDVAFAPEQERSFLELIDEECDRLTRLVDNLLDASRLEAGVVAVRPMRVDVGDVIASAIAGMSEHEVPVEVSLPPDLPLIVVDPDLLERVVANLTANACRYSPPDGIVRVTAGIVGSSLQVLVVDRGPGIAAAHRDEVRRPFQRLDDQGRTPAGIGLGLSIAQGFTELLGGSLQLDDTPGGGLTVVISLPLAEDSR